MSECPKVVINRLPTHLLSMLPAEVTARRVVADLLIFGRATLPSGDVVYAPPSDIQTTGLIPTSD
jgi:hypothetical protein